MAVRIEEAPHFEKESTACGATKAEINSARSLVQAAVDGRQDIVEFKEIEVTKLIPAFRPWSRIKGKQSGIRVAVEYYSEGSDTVVLIHAVVPRDNHTYEVIENLWKKYRSKA